MVLSHNFHEGEKRVQAEEGIDVDAYEAVMTEPFSPELNPVEIRFVNGRSFSVAASVDGSGQPWATPLFGQPGELFDVQDPTTVRITTGLPADHPLHQDVADNGELGVLYFDPSLRRRAKSLGHGTIEPDGSLIYRMTRNFGVCNRYIFKRTHEPSTASDSTAVERDSARSQLTDDDIARLQHADTAFFASRHTDRGVETTHRGGPAGFISVEDATTISLPDYPGNGMFNTLGNLLLDDRIGLTTIDFATGQVVQVTGRGQVVPSPDDDTMSTRTVRIAVDEVRSTTRDIGAWTDVEAFPVRPGMYNPGTPYLPGRGPAGRS